VGGSDPKETQKEEMLSKHDGNIDLDVYPAHTDNTPAKARIHEFLNVLRQMARSILNEEEMMKKFTQRVLISGAAGIAIMGAVGGVDLLGKTHASPTPCVKATALCQPQQVKGPSLNRLAIICQPTGPKGGAYCRTPHGR
jgi:hypothetical protein